MTAAERRALASFLEALSALLMEGEPLRLPRTAGYCDHVASVARNGRDVLGALEAAEALLRE
jgi:hypothetical protein